MTSMPNSSRLPEPTPERNSSTYRWIILILGLVVVFLGAVRITSMRNPALPQSQLKKMWAVPPFALTERSGRNVTNRDLAGKIWIADFVYTTCPGPCPIISTNMAQLQDLLANDPHVMLVSITVDPVTDTPPVLAKYADGYHADPNRWWFLTGPEKQVYDLIQNGFYLSAVDNAGKPPEAGQYKVTHSTNLALVDADGNVRGYYDGVGADGRKDLLRDIKIIEKEEQP